MHSPCCFVVNARHFLQKYTTTNTNSDMQECTMFVYSPCWNEVAQCSTFPCLFVLHGCSCRCCLMLKHIFTVLKTVFCLFCTDKTAEFRLLTLFQVGGLHQPNSLHLLVIQQETALQCNTAFGHTGFWRCFTLSNNSKSLQIKCDFLSM